MVLLHQAVKQWFLAGAPNLRKLQRLELAQPVFYGHGIDPRRLRLVRKGGLTDSPKQRVCPVRAGIRARR
jgi:hypothetical protein